MTETDKTNWKNENWQTYQKANWEKTKLYDKIQKKDKTKLSDGMINDKDNNTNW